MKITISGKIGSGKTTLSKALCKRLKLKYLSTGDSWRELAEEKGITVTEVVKLAEKQTKYHKKCDEKTKQIGKTQDNFVFDSRLAFHFIKNTIKIFLDVNIDVAAKRVFNQKRKKEKENSSVEKTKKTIKQREKSELKAYKKLYNLNHFDKKHFDLVVDTSKLTTKQTADKVINFLKQKL